MSFEAYNMEGKNRALADLQYEHDKLVERSVGAMAIADGDEGYEKIPLDCPMLKSVGMLRVVANNLRADGNALRDMLKQTLEANKRLRAGKKALRHASSCSNVNPIHPEGAYEGVEECGCQRSEQLKAALRKIVATVDDGSISAASLRTIARKALDSQSAKACES
jgi:hypothetical protein